MKLWSEGIVYWKWAREKQNSLFQFPNWFPSSLDAKLNCVYVCVCTSAVREFKQKQFKFIKVMVFLALSTHRSLYHI